VQQSGRLVRPEFVYGVRPSRLPDLVVAGLRLGPALGFAADLLGEPLGRAAGLYIRAGLQELDNIAFRRGMQGKPLRAAKGIS